MRTKPVKKEAPTTFRCAIYTRKSTEEGLEQEFNTLHNQRESAEAYVKSQAAEGWVCLPEHYDDGGWSGGNMERPALQRLLADIKAGKVDIVIVYKVDRLSRSLLDFTKMMEVFEAHNVAFVSTTQQIHTGTSMGRLILNVLLSFAQFERELVSERTKDKIAASRRRGKWAGGTPLLGYDRSETKKLVINDAEAARVRAMFDLYLQHEALLPVVKELERRGWRNKRWTTKKGKELGGHPFVKTNLHRLLTSPLYIGKVQHHENLYQGEHQAIVAPEVFQKVQEIMARNATTGGAKVRNKFGAFLKGLIRCVPCGCSMTPAHTTKRNRRFRYYCCTAAQKRGWSACPSKSIPAAQIEQFVLDRIRAIGADPALCRETLAQARTQAQGAIQGLDAERVGLERDLAHWDAEVGHVGARNGNPARLSEIEERASTARERLAAVDGELAALQAEMVSEGEVVEALGRFDGVWESLTPREHGRLVELLVERVDFDGGKGQVTIQFHASGIHTLANQLKETA